MFNTYKMTIAYDQTSTITKKIIFSTRDATHFYIAVAKCPRACASFVLQGQDHAHVRCNALLRCYGKVPTLLRIVCPAGTGPRPRAVQRTSTLLWKSAHALAHRLSCRDKNMPTRAATPFYFAVAKCPRACALFITHRYAQRSEFQMSWNRTVVI